MSVRPALLNTGAAVADTALVRDIKFVIAPSEMHWRWLLQAMNRRWWFVLSVGGYLFIAIALLDLANGHSLWPVAFPLGMVFLLLPMLILRLGLRRIATNRVAYAEREVTISDRGVEVVLPVVRVWYDLSLLKQILTAPWGWVLVSEAGGVIFVPRDRLEPQDIEEMESLAGAHTKAALVVED
jgi:hypothetical protein